MGKLCAETSVSMRDTPRADPATRTTFEHVFIGIVPSRIRCLLSSGDTIAMRANHPRESLVWRLIRDQNYPIG